MKAVNFKNLVMGSVLVITGLMGVNVLNAQSTREYNDWRRAQREAERQRRQYQRTRSVRDYREWQRAVAEAQRERRDFQQERREDFRDDYRDNRRQMRIYRNGSYYNVDSRGVNLLRQAVNRGYQQGYREGQMDRRHNRGRDYYGSRAYRSGLFGYQSYVDRSHYRYYFQQGFQRGYEDGFNIRTRYGYRSGSGFNILGNILNTILNVADN